MDIIEIVKSEIVVDCPRSGCGGQVKAVLKDECGNAVDYKGKCLECGYEYPLITIFESE